jgi:hypothetical protein
MIRLVSLAAAALSAAVLLPGAAQAQQHAGYYTATPVAAPAEANYVSRSTVWSCAGGVCTAGKAADRAEFVCQRLAKSVGKLDAFTVAGEALDADKLAKCNAKAR